MLLRDKSWWCMGWLCDFSECFMPWCWHWKEKRVVFGSYSWSLSFVVVNAWCNSSSRSKWMYYIEGTKMVLVCCSGSSKPEKMYLEQACSSRAEKVSCLLLKFLGLWDDSDFGCLNLLAGISWRCCVERCPFPHQVLLIGEKSSLLGITITWSWVGDHSFIEDKVLLKGIYWLPQFDSQFKDNGW